MLLIGFVLAFLGNWQGTAKFKLKFTSGGAIEFGQAMLRAGQLGKFYNCTILPTVCSNDAVYVR